MDKEKKLYVGIDVGGTGIKFGAFTSQGELLSKWTIPTRKEDNGKLMLEDIACSIEAFIEKSQLHKSQIKGIGMGVPGPVQTDGYVENLINIGLRDLYPSRVLKERLQIDTIEINNDANIAALGEQWMGAGKGYDNMMFYTLGTGIGGGLILDGKIVNGAKGMAGEVGHLRVNREETQACGCGGYGCVEQYASATGIVRQMHKAIDSIKATSSGIQLPVWTVTNFTCKEIFAAAKAGEELASQVVKECLYQLAQSMAFVTYVIDPACFVIGGGVSNAGQYLVDIVQNYYNGLTSLSVKKAEFYLAKLGNDAGIYGAARMAIQNPNIM